MGAVAPGPVPQPPPPEAPPSPEAPPPREPLPRGGRGWRTRPDQARAGGPAPRPSLPWTENGRLPCCAGAPVRRSCPPPPGPLLVVSGCSGQLSRAGPCWQGLHAAARSPGPGGPQPTSREFLVGTGQLPASPAPQAVGVQERGSPAFCTLPPLPRAVPVLGYREATCPPSPRRGSVGGRPGPGIKASAGYSPAPSPEA